MAAKAPGKPVEDSGSRAMPVLFLTEAGLCTRPRRLGDPIAKATTVGANCPPRKTKLIFKTLKQQASWEAAEACFIPT